MELLSLFNQKIEVNKVYDPACGSGLLLLNFAQISRLVPNSEIAEQNYNVSVSTYVEQEDTREVVDITALNAEIERIVSRENVLRHEINVITAEIEGEVLRNE